MHVQRDQRLHTVLVVDSAKVEVHLARVVGD